MKICSKGFTFENCIYSPSDCGANCNEKIEVKMRNFDRIKNYSIEEMAEFLAIMQVNAIKQIIVPNEEEQINRYKNSLIKLLESEE